MAREQGRVRSVACSASAHRGAESLVILSGSEGFAVPRAAEHSKTVLEGDAEDAFCGLPFSGSWDANPAQSGVPSSCTSAGLTPALIVSDSEGSAASLAPMRTAHWIEREERILRFAQDDIGASDSHDRVIELVIGHAGNVARPIDCTLYSIDRRLCNISCGSVPIDASVGLGDDTTCRIDNRICTIDDRIVQSALTGAQAIVELARATATFW